MSIRLNTRCGRCRYGYKHTSLETGCNYNGIEGRTRLAQIYKLLGVKKMTKEARELMSPGKCPFFKWDGVTHENGRHGNCTLDWEKAAELHDQKMSVGQIAKGIGASVSTVYDWYRRSGRKPHPYVQRKLDRGNMLKLYMLGMTDEEIAAEAGCCVDSVRHWRGEQGLEANRRTKEDKA